MRGDDAAQPAGAVGCRAATEQRGHRRSHARGAGYDRRLSPLPGRAAHGARVARAGRLVLRGECDGHACRQRNDATARRLLLRPAQHRQPADQRAHPAGPAAHHAGGQRRRRGRHGRAGASWPGDPGASLAMPGLDGECRTVDSVVARRQPGDCRFRPAGHADRLCDDRRGEGAFALATPGRRLQGMGGARLVAASGQPGRRQRAGAHHHPGVDGRQPRCPMAACISGFSTSARATASSSRRRQGARC